MLQLFNKEDMTTMYNRILVALDFPEPAVFEAALSIAEATEANLLILHAINERDANSPVSPIATAWDFETPMAEEAWKTYQKQWKAYAAKSLDILRDYTGRAEAVGVTADFIQATNDPGRAICESAQTWKADLIVMGTHQRRGLQELLIGSVSNYVIHHAPCSVMVVALKHDQSESPIKASVDAYQAA